MSKSTSRLVNATRQHDELTANLAVTHSTSLSNVVDMFFVAGATRNMSDMEIITLFERAFQENPDMALKCLFWARDVRGGAGERRFFRTVWRYLYNGTNKMSWYSALDILVPEYGRWDDVWKSHPVDDDTADWLSRGLTEREDGLLAKWLPRSGPVFNAIRKQLGYTPKQLRDLLVKLSDTVEQKMSAKKWDAIDYSHVPSVAMNKYRKAFLRNDESRFNQYIELVNSGEAEIKAGAIFPHDIVHKMLDAMTFDHDMLKAAVTQWNALPNYMEGSKERILPVVDTSGSMSRRIGKTRLSCLEVAISLGLYISERNEGLFKDAFITFSARPEMQYLQGDVYKRMVQLRHAHWDMNTNLQAVFDLILDRARNNGLSEEEMPTKVLILSDMEFDRCEDHWGRTTSTNFEAVDAKYKRAGYKRPQIIFWNLNGRLGNVPVNVDDNGTALVSGFSPAILKDIIRGEITTPQAIVYKVLNGPRYESIHTNY